MSPNLIKDDAICDLHGQPLHPKSATLLKALDKLLTVGAYYSPEHGQYLQAAMKARDEIVGVIGATNHHVAIEITAQGLMVGKQNIDPHHRNVRLLHDLLVPLNIAKLEIDGTLSPEDLRQALAALQEHKQSLGQSNSFQEVVIHNLPPSVRAVSCTVLHKADDATGDLSLDDLLGQWGTEDEAETGPVAETQSELLAQEFMDMVAKILENLEELERELGVRPQNEKDGSYVTQAELTNLKIALQRLVEVNPDPADLAQLIAQAQRALDLSRDSQSVNLVFQILKKDMSKEKDPKTEKKPRPQAPVSYKMTVEQLLGTVTELEKLKAPVAEPVAGSKANQLGVSLHLLRSDPPRALRTTMVDLVHEALGETEFAAINLEICAQAAHTIASEDGVESIDDILPVLTGAVRQRRPELVASFWTHLLKFSADKHLPELWPHLVNDILLGLDKASRELVLPLVVAAGSISLKDAKRQGRRLEKQPALQSRPNSRDLFLAPLPSTYNVLVPLADSPLRDWLGAELFRVLRTHPGSPLVEVVMTALAEHEPHNTGFYLDLIRYGTAKERPSDFQQQVASLLQAALATVSGDARKERWVTLGLIELAKLAPDLAAPLCEMVVAERKLIFFKAWPPEPRQAAIKALAHITAEVK